MREQAGSDPLASALATDAQLTLDLAVRYRVLDRWELYATCRNLLDAHPIVSHRPFGARPSAPRFIQVGTKLTL
jgi:Fe(3+) dicitrate transport protein